MSRIWLIVAGEGSRGGNPLWGPQSLENQETKAGLLWRNRHCGPRSGAAQRTRTVSLLLGKQTCCLYTSAANCSVFYHSDLSGQPTCVVAAGGLDGGLLPHSTKTGSNPTRRPR